MRYPEIARELLAMERVDQEMRGRQLKEPDYWDDVDRRHTRRMAEIVIRIGWPTVSKVGDEASHAAWLLVQHADHDVVFQRACLSLMKLMESASETGITEVRRSDIAYLEDRVRVNLGKPQLYGTQFMEVDGRFVSWEIENPEEVNKRRLQMGLGTLEDGILEMYEKYPD